MSKVNFFICIDKKTRRLRRNFVDSYVENKFPRFFPSFCVTVCRKISSTQKLVSNGKNILEGGNKSGSTYKDYDTSECK